MSNIAGGFGSSTAKLQQVNYGSDLSCLNDLDPSMLETSGLHMLAQALCRRLITPRGTLIDDANYGFDLRQFLGDDLAPADVARISAGVDAELVKDERVAASQTTAGLLSGVLTVSTAVTPSSGPNFQLVVAVSAVTVALLSPTL